MRNLSNLYVDGVVGIGTTTPTQKLQVSSGDIMIDSGYAMHFTTTADFTKIQRSNNALQLFNNSTVMLSLNDDGSGYFAGSGNVGIGTANPTLVNWGRELVVSQTSGTQPEAFLALQGSRTGDNNIGGVVFYNSSNALVSIAAMRYGSDNSGALKISTANSGTISERIRITSGGNVLIGTTTDSGEKLQVTGSVKTTGSIDLATGGSGSLYLNGVSVLSRTGTYTQIGNPEGAITLYLGDSADRTNYYDNNAHTFRNAGGGSTYAVINSSGNVGIGTTSPSTALDVGDGQISGVDVLYGDSSGSLLLAGYDKSSLASSFIGFYTANGTASGERMRIDSAGNVGIGETSIDARLHITSSGAVVNQKFELSGVAAWRVGIPNGQTYFAFDNTADALTSPKVVIASTGNVGIGTTSPAVDLHVVDDVRIDDQLYVRSISSQYFSSANNLSLIYGDAANFIVSSNATERFRITAAGNVGIGGSPASVTHGPHLDIVGNRGTLTVGTGYFEDNGTTNFLNGARPLAFGYAGSEYMRIHSSGNVGIGTTSPGAKLQISSGNNVDTQLLVGEGSTYGAPSIRFKTASTNYMGIGFTTGSVVGNEVLDAISIQRTGNVGIGTTSPDVALDIQMSTASQGLKIRRHNNSGQYLHLHEADGSAHWISAVGEKWMYIDNQGATYGTIIRTNGNDRVVFTSGGNVLIGTSTDAGYRLDIAGNLRAVGTSHTLDAGAYELNVVSSGLTATLGGSTGGDIGGKAATYHFGGVGSTLRVGPQYTSDRDYIEIVAGNTNSLLRTHNELLTVKNTGGHVILEPLNNVGIGTTSPTAKLHIVGANSNSEAVYLFGDANYGATVHYDRGGSYAWRAGVGGGSSTSSIPSSYWGIEDASIGASRLVIAHTSGNVGIGTNGPGGKLSVFAPDGNSSSLELGRADTGSVWKFNHAGADLRIYNTAASGSDILFGVDSGGIVKANNVGVGTATPLTKLSVSSSGANGIDISADQGNSSISGRLFLSNGTSGQSSVLMNNGGNLAFHTQGTPNSGSGTERMRITSDGNVGIGTTSPKTIFDIRPAGITGLTMPTFGTAAYGGIHIVPSGLATTEAWYGITFGNTASTSSERERSTAGIYTSASGTYGNKLYFATSSSWATGAVSRMMIDHTGNVGIGTTSPDRKLHLEDSTRMDIKFKMSGSTTSDHYIRKDGRYLRFRGQDDNTVILELRNNADGNQVLMPSGGNVIIGSSTDNGYKLQVNGTAKIQAATSAALTFEQDSNVYQAAINSSAHLVLQSAANNQIIFKDGGATNMVIDGSTANVGIGTTSPSFKLDVNEGGLRSIRSSAGWAGWFENTGDSSGVVVTAGVDSGDAPLLIRKQDGTELFSIRGNGTSWFNNGNLGIGTTSPAYKLDVAGDIRTTGVLRATSHVVVGGYLDITGIINHRSDIKVLNKLATNWITWATRDTSGTDSVINLSNIGTLTATGNVLIGTTTDAGYKLDVNGTFKSNALWTDGSANAYWGNGGTSTAYGLLTWDTSLAKVIATSGNRLDLGANGSTFATIATSGNVGIGTTNPSYNLDVQGTTNGIIRAYGGSIGRLSLQNSTRHYSLSVQGSSFYLYDEVGAATRMLIDSSGNVGIGTTSPGTKLEVNGGRITSSISSSHTTGTISYNDANLDLYNSLAADTDEKGSIITFTDNYFNGTNYIKTTRAAIKGGTDTTGNTADGFLAFYTDSAGANSANERMRIDKSGNVGIGTTTPSAKLHVAGGIKLSDNQYLSWDSSNTRIVGQSGYLQLQVAASDVMRLTSGGNVLIGTTTDNGKKLQVQGDVFIKGSASTSSTKIFEVQNSNGTSIMDFRGDAYAFFGCGQGGGAASGFIFRYNDTSHVQFTGYNYGNGSGSYKPILLDTDLVGRGQGIYVNFGGTGYANPAPLSTTEFAVRGRTSDSSQNVMQLRDSNNTDKFVVRNDGAIFTAGSQGWTGTVSCPSNPVGQRNLEFTNGILTNVY